MISGGEVALVIAGAGLAAGLFANGNPDTAAWNGVNTPMTGLLFGGSTQMIAQVLEAAAVAAFVIATSYALFAALKRAGLLRSRAEDEIGGLDMPEMGSMGYVAGGLDPPPHKHHAIDDQQPTGQLECSASDE